MSTKKIFPHNQFTVANIIFLQRLTECFGLWRKVFVGSFLVYLGSICPSIKIYNFHKWNPKKLSMDDLPTPKIQDKDVSPDNDS